MSNYVRRERIMRRSGVCYVAENADTLEYVCPTRFRRVASATARIRSLGGGTRWRVARYGYARKSRGRHR